jgi:hypothetical protein
MDMNKSHWVVGENTVQLTVPFAKYDAEARTVTGFATLDNIDGHNEVVTAEASKVAFSRARGNLREMHQPIAAGRVVNFQEEEFYDPETQKFYRGIYVTAYVSKGAQATWEKVLDGTLTGFSIGGSIKESETQWVKDADASVRFIKDYDLIELSLVDNPANALANVFTIQKSAEGSVIKGMIAETKIENVFWCNTDGVARVLNEESADCLTCGQTMENIGWIESGEDKTEKVRAVVSKFLSPNEKDEGGVENMGKKETEVEKTATAEEEVVEAEAVEAGTEEEAPEAKEETEETAEVSEVEEVDLQKLFDDLKATVNDSLTNTKDELEKTVSDKVAELTKTLEDKTSELSKTVDELSEKVKSVTESSEEVTKRLGDLEGSTAERKSGDLEEEPEETVQKSTGWNGTFLSVHNLR